MPITQNAKKAIKSSARKRVFNIRKQRVLHEETKTFKTLLKEGKKEEAQKLLPTVYKAIDKAAQRGLIKQNTAARKKSRLTKALARIS
jgi:small subunit ribosomal protein S20